VILMVSDGVSLSEISRKVGLARRIVRKWAARFAVDRFRGLADAPSGGAGPAFVRRHVRRHAMVWMPASMLSTCERTPLL
jgi:transposase-like protein